MVNMLKSELNADGAQGFPFTVIQLAKYFRCRLQQDGVIKGRQAAEGTEAVAQKAQDTADMTQDEEEELIE